MKRKIVCTIASATGVISSSLIFQACDKAESADELNQMLQSDISLADGTIGMPIAVPLSEQDQEYVCFLRQLSSEIIENPKIAKEFADNPNEYCIKHGYKQHINIDQTLLKIILALGDTKINDSINTGDVNSYIKACKENGLLEFNSLNKDPYLKKLSSFVKNQQLQSKLKQPQWMSRASIETDMGNINNVDNFSVVYGAVAIVIAAVAVEAFIVIGTTTWVTHVHESTNKDAQKNTECTKTTWLKYGILRVMGKQIM